MTRGMSVVVAEVMRFGARRLPRGVAITAVALAVSGVAITLAQGSEITFDTALPATLLWVGQLLVFFSVALGASALAAEWNSGSLAMLLVFDPNRVRVLLGKALAAATGCAVVAVVVLAIVTAAVGVGAAISGTFDADDPATEPATLVDDDDELTTDELPEFVLRTVAACALAGVLGCAAGALVRRTAGVVAGFLILFMAGEWAIGSAFRMDHFWGPARSLVAIAVGPIDLVSVQEASGPYVLSGIAWTVGALVAALVWFSRVEVATGPR